MITTNDGCCVQFEKEFSRIFSSTRTMHFPFEDLALTTLSDENRIIFACLLYFCQSRRVL